MGLMLLTALVQILSFHRSPDSRQRDPEKAEKAESRTLDKLNISDPVINVNPPVIDIIRPVQIQEPEVIHTDVDPTNYLSDDDNDIEEEEEEAHPQRREPSRRFRRFATWTTTTSARSAFASAPFRRTFTNATTATATVLPWYLRLKSYVLPSEPTSSELEHFVPNYRWSPIISGVLIPFSILLEIPGLTERWYIQTLNNKTVDTRPNPILLDVGMGVSIACALIANICLILRFLERHIKTMTVSCIFFLTVHDVINICTVAIFGIEHRSNDGFTYGQAFWMSLCSTITSTITNVGLIYDLARTPDFTNNGSGLTRKQRALVIIEITLLLYIAFGAAINSQLLHISYIDGLYFTVVSIETIGFGDITPRNTGSRVFICFYIALGILNIGLFVAMCRETMLEALELGYRKRVRNIRQRRREARRYRRWETRWRQAVEWRLRENKQPIWVPNSVSQRDGPHFVGLRALDGADGRTWLSRLHAALGLGGRAEDAGPRYVVGHPRGKRLNIQGLTDAQLESAALEAGLPLDKFIVRRAPSQSPSTANTPPATYGVHSGATAANIGAAHALGGSLAWPAHPQTPTHAQVGRMAAMMTKVALALVEKHALSAEDEQEGDKPEDIDLEADLRPPMPIPESSSSRILTEKDEGPADTDSGYAQSPKHERPGEHDDAVHIGMREQDEEPQDMGEEDVEDVEEQHRRALSVSDIRRFARVPKWVRELAHGGSQRSGSYDTFSDDFKIEERRAHYAKLIIAWTLFLVFWFVGSGIFSATEGWSYGIAMYFCFVAFTTTGYGDFSPQTPAGRSIFVVWALFGVATLTILVSVIQEAGSSRYKDVLHSRVFEKAVKKYRKKEAREAAELPHTAARLQTVYLNASTNALYGANHGNGKGNDGGHVDRNGNSEPPTPAGGMQSPLEETAARLSKSQEVTQHELEMLPEQIIMHAHAFHDYLQYFVGNKHDSINMQRDVESLVPDELKSMLDDIAQAEGISERVKREILQDKDARNVLFMLSVERALKRMTSAAERALATISERDTLQALHDEQKEQAKRPSRRSLSRTRSVSVPRSVRSIRSVRSARSIRSDLSDDEPRSGYATADELTSPISPTSPVGSISPISPTSPMNYASPISPSSPIGPSSPIDFAPPIRPGMDRSMNSSSHRSLHRTSTSLHQHQPRARSGSPRPSIRIGSRQDIGMSVHVASEQMMASEQRAPPVSGTVEVEEIASE